MAINNTLPSSNPFGNLLRGLQAPAINISGIGGGTSKAASPIGIGKTTTPASSALSSRINSTPSKPAPIVTPAKTAAPTSTVNLSGVPQSAIDALSSGGLKGNDLALAQKALASHYATTTPNTGSAPNQNNVPGLLTPPTPPTTPTASVNTTPSYQGLVSTILDRTSKPNREVQDAYDAQQRANSNLETFRESVADTTRGIYSAPTSARVMQGRDQAIQVANASKEAALGSQLESATSLYNAAQTGQGQQLNALTSTLGTVAPQLGAYGQTYYSPLDPSSGGDASSITGGWAQFLASGGDPSQVPAAVSSNPVLWQQTLNAAKQQNPSFDVNTALGAAAGRQSNASTAGSAVINTAAQGYQTTTQNYNQMTAVNNAAHTQAGNLKNILEKTGINANDPTLFNKALNKVSKFTSSPEYASFATALTELQNMYSQLLQTGGGTPTGNEQQALNVLNPNSSAAAIGAAIGQLEQAAYAKLNAQYNQANGYLQQLQGQGGNAPASTGGSTSGTISTSIGSFVKDANGKWVPAR